MTFEDYIKEVEIFGKIDTAEKLAFYEHQYKNHLLRKEDQNYFEPYEDSLIKNLSGVYDENLNRIFNLNSIGENQFYFFVKPSFEPEYLLILTRQSQDYRLTCTRLTKNYWLVFYADNTVTTIDSLQYQITLTKSLGDKLFFLLDKTMNEAKLPRSKFFTLDGLIYILSKKFNDKIKSVFKHSPDEDSKSGKFISIMEDLNDIIMASDHTKLTDLEIRIDKLIV